MSQNVNRSDSDVVYLVPCKEKHIASQVICAGKSQLDLIKIHLSYVGSPTLPVVTLGNSNVPKKLDGQDHCSLVKNKWNSHLRKNNQRCLPNGRLQTTHPAPAPATPISTNSIFESHAYDAGHRVNVADFCDPFSLIQNSDEVKNDDNQNDALNIDEFCSLLRDISEQGIISEDKDNFLSNKEMSSEVPYSAAQNLTDSLKPVLANGVGEIPFPASDNPSSDFYPDKAVATSLGQANPCSGTGYGQPYMLSDELVWTRQAPRPTVMPVTSTSNMMWTCDQESVGGDLMCSFEDIPSISNNGQAVSSSYPQLNGNLYDQTAHSEIIGVNRTAEYDLEKLHDSGMTFNISNLPNMVPESNLSEVAETLDTVKDDRFQSTLDCTRPDIKISEVAKEPIKSNEVSNINDIISDVADILDEIQTTNDAKLTVPEENFFLDPEPSNSSVLDHISSSSSSINEKSPLDDFITSLDGTADFALDTLFQTPESIQKANENANGKTAGGYLSNEGGSNTYFEDSSAKSESALIFSELITSPEEYQNHSEKSTSVSESKNCGLANAPSIANVTVTSSNLPTKNVQPNCSAADSSGIPKRVAFKVRPAGKPSRSFDKGRTAEKISRSMPKPLQPTLGKDRSLKIDYRSSKPVEAYTEQLKGNAGLNKNVFNPNYASLKYFGTPYDEPRAERASSSRGNIKRKQNNVILPIGKTGMSIAIPDTVKTDMVSFIPAGEKICQSSTKVLPGSTSCDQLNTGRDLISGRPKKSVLHYIKPSFQNADYIVSSSSNPKGIGTLNQVIQQTILETTDVLVSVPSSTVTFSSGGQIANPYSQNSNCKPIYVVLPSTTSSISNGVGHYSLPITSITSQAGKPKSNPISTLQIVQVDGRDTILKPVWSIAPGVSKKASDKISEPIRITVRTRPRTIAPNQGAYGSGDRNILGSDDRLKMKCALSAIPRAVKNRNLVKELKIHFPTVSEAILQQLTIPPQAVNRGFLTRQDLQNLHNQALKLHLSIVYRNHVTKCTNYDCETCRNFVGQQDSLKWSLKEQQNKSKTAGRNSKGKKGQIKPKKSVKKCIRTKNTNGEDDDPTYEPPVSYFKAWKRKIDTNWCSRQPMKILKVNGHIGSGNVNDTKKQNIFFRNIQPTGNTTEKWKTSLKRSLSEPAIPKSVGQNSDNAIKHTQDDMNIRYRENPPQIQYTVTLPTLSTNESGLFMENFSEKSSGNIHQIPAASSEKTVMYQPPLLEERKDLNMNCKVQQWPSIYSNQNYTYPCGINQNFNATNLQSSIMNYPYAATESVDSQMPPQPMPLNSECQYSPALYLEKGCNCNESCRTMKCPCARAGVLCRVNQACSCKNCDNPLNILHQHELDVLLARVDECLMQNLYSYEISGLCKLLVSEVVLPCCSTTSKLQHIIPGTMICSCCGNAVTYSWCTHSVHLQTICPRNHCMVCCACKPTLHTHCQNCQQCTASANQGTCMECGMIKLFAV